MENAVEALKIAFAMALFIIALTMSISSFSQATDAVKAITTLRDREEQYTYVQSTSNLTRTVGIETVVSTMYRARKENIEIRFLNNTGRDMELLKKTDGNGNIEKNESGQEIIISYIDFSKMTFPAPKDGIDYKTQFLDVLLAGKHSDIWNELDENYKKRFIYDEGLYNKLKDIKFEEQLGEYYQGSGASQTKKRVITYIVQEGTI